MPTVPYDAFADIYDVWCDTAPITREHPAFYIGRFVATEGPVVELGVGNGRLCIGAAKQGKAVAGVDSSRAILELCRRRAEAASVSDLVTLVEGDFRDFELPAPAELIAMPFHAIGHLLDEDAKRRALANIRRQLRPGGLFIFDHFVFDPDYPFASGVAHLRAEFTHPETGRDVLLWEATSRDLDAKRLHIVAWTDELDEAGVVLERRYRRIDLSWLTPDESRSLLETSGFEVVEAYGDFQGSPLGPESRYQVWVARPSE